MPSGVAVLLYSEGVMREFAAAFYKSKAWKDCRAAYIRRVGGLCERCLERGVYRAGEIVHHKVYITPETVGDPSVLLSFGNLELLCRECHGEEHGRLKKRYRFDEDGRCVCPPVDG